MKRNVEYNKMNVVSLCEQQKELRVAFMGGFAGQLVSGIIWIISAIVGELQSESAAILVLFFGCMWIYPLTKLVLRLMGRAVLIIQTNALWKLGAQLAFTVPINFLLVWIMIQYDTSWFYPAVMILVGAHYLPFITLYGMKMFGILGGIIVVLGTVMIFGEVEVFVLGGWITGLILVVFAFIGKYIVNKEIKNEINT